MKSMDELELKRRQNCRRRTDHPASTPEPNGATFRQDARGIAAVEFALMTPVLCFLLVGAIDLGGALFTRFQLDSAVAAGANIAQVEAANVSSTNGATLASNIASIVENSAGSGWANDTVVVNNGPTTTVTNGGTPSNGGSASDA